MARRFKLEEGERLGRSPNSPIISVVEADRSARPYIWIGNDARDDKMCYATLSGRENLQRLASRILKALGDK